ncbi:MAG: hypothetical protein KFB96_18960 [Thiocapsa sp.]|uniref:hypothetical protein n=2 Tax=Thiocapsa sp. TaxID=2024551 RepID=UPI001BCDCD7A|nr:hypothetical protein [Thiocapsa sp.]QVL47742.1 MAG: hypothetical protein KFB96_18960 [Thiocapsa sp.]
MMPIVVFTDLDDTLFQTAEKAAARAGDGPLIAAAHDRGGAPLSFHAPDQIALLELFDGAHLIPVTGRNGAALDRVVSPRFESFRITGHGAMIYDVDGAPLASWHARIQAEAMRLEPLFEALLRTLDEQFAPRAPAWRWRLIEDAAVPVYITVKAEANVPLPEAATLQSVLDARGLDDWRVHCNGRNAALLPPYACKAAAVRHLMELIAAQAPRTLFIGLGDSNSDTPYLKLCHFALTPRDSQIHQELWT